MAVRGLADGNPLLRPGAVVRLDPPPGLTQLARRVVLTEVRHTIDDFAGFVSQISSVPAPADPGDQARRGSCELALATVDRVDDPHGAGRVKLTLDAYGDVETEWLPVLSSGAGAAGGLLAQPDVGDHVLLLSSNSDPGWGVVLGGLYVERLPEEVVQGGRTRRQIWATSGGQRIGLDDVENSVTVSDKGGSRLELKPGLVTVRAAGDLEISAPGKAIRITAATVDFLQG
jgi:phage baseplate assembly protein gpV